jgi:hypothetical protein
MPLVVSNDDDDIMAELILSHSYTSHNQFNFLTDELLTPLHQKKRTLISNDRSFKRSVAGVYFLLASRW